MLPKRLLTRGLYAFALGMQNVRRPITRENAALTSLLGFYSEEFLETLRNNKRPGVTTLLAYSLLWVQHSIVFYWEDGHEREAGPYKLRVTRRGELDFSVVLEAESELLLEWRTIPDKRGVHDIYVHKTEEEAVKALNFLYDEIIIRRNRVAV